MTATVRELKVAIAEMERKVDIAKQAGDAIEEEYTEKVGALLVEIARQHVSARQRKIPPVLEAAIRGGKLFPSERSIFEAHLMAVPFEKFEAELEKVRLSFEERLQVIELGMEYGLVEQLPAPGSGEDPRTREELGEELKAATRAHAQVIGSSGIQDPVAESIAHELEEEVKK